MALVVLDEEVPLEVMALVVLDEEVPLGDMALVVLDEEVPLGVMALVVLDEEEEKAPWEQVEEHIQEEEVYGRSLVEVVETL